MPANKNSNSNIIEMSSDSFESFVNDFLSKSSIVPNSASGGNATGSGTMVSGERLHLSKRSQEPAANDDSMSPTVTDGTVNGKRYEKPDAKAYSMAGKTASKMGVKIIKRSAKF